MVFSLAAPSYIFIYLSISTVIFAGLYNVGSSVVLKLDFVFYRFIYSYLLTAVRAIIIYYIIRIFKISFLNKLSIRGSILNGILLVVIFVPFMIITISDPYELAIKTDNFYVSYLTYNKDEDTDRYYQLKYLSLLGSQQNADDKIIGFSCYLESRDEDLDDTGEIMAIYILKEYQGLGIGKKLMEVCYKEISKYSKLSLWVLGCNKKSVGFYERQGFIADGKTKMLHGKEVIRMIKNL
jgi:ribosomal protein S18 acetylase RimI-like enzyme